MQRPLCPYPQKAWRQGDGDANQAASFTCSSENKWHSNAARQGDPKSSSSVQRRPRVGLLA